MINGRFIFFGGVLFLVTALLLKDFFGVLAGVFITPIDKLLFFSNMIPPVLMWTLLGAMIGAIYGSFIAVKKYRLDMKLIMYPVAFLLIISGLLLIPDKQPTELIIAKPPVDQEKLDLFNENIQNGIRAVDNEEFTSAEYYFQKAARADATNPKLDSLAKIYTDIGDDKCKKYRRKKRLKYLSNYYYQYAAALTGTTPIICN